MTSTLSLGPLVLVATQHGPMVDVGVSTPTNVVPLAGTLHLALPEWQSLVALVDVLHAADRRHAKARAEIDVLRQECRELTAQRDAAFSALALRERMEGGHG